MELGIWLSFGKTSEFRGGGGGLNPQPHPTRYPTGVKTWWSAVNLHKNSENSWLVGRLLISKEGRRYVAVQLITTKKVRKLQLHLTSWLHVWTECIALAFLSSAVDFGYSAEGSLRDPQKKRLGASKIFQENFKKSKSCPCRESDHVLSIIQSASNHFADYTSQAFAIITVITID
jgi:hypothetical protein